MGTMDSYVFLRYLIVINKVNLVLESQHDIIFVKMKTIKHLFGMLVAAFILSSCVAYETPTVSQSSMPMLSVDAIKEVPNMYAIGEDISATATVTLDGAELNEENSDLSLYPFYNYSRNRFFTAKGILQLGQIGHDSIGESVIPSSAEDISRRIAMRRLIDAAKAKGANAVIEPVITTSATKTSTGKYSYKLTYTTEIKSKVVKIK